MKIIKTNERSASSPTISMSGLTRIEVSEADALLLSQLEAQARLALQLAGSEDKTIKVPVQEDDAEAYAEEVAALLISVDSTRTTEPIRFDLNTGLTSTSSCDGRPSHSEKRIQQAAATRTPFWYRDWKINRPVVEQVVPTTVEDAPVAVASKASAF